MKNLMSLYDELENPLNNPQLIRSLITLYSSGKDFYKELTIQNSDNKVYKEGQHYRQDSDELYSALFNAWKNNIANMTVDTYNKFYSNKGIYTDTDFQTLQNYLKGIQDVSTEDEVNKLLYPNNNEPLNDAIRKYTFQSDSMYWTRIKSSKLAEKPISKISHRLYLNFDHVEQYQMVICLLKKFSENDLDYHFKFNHLGVRDDTIVIYSSHQNLPKYLEILQEIANENPDIIKKAFPPPILTGKINDWIGYGSEPVSDEDSFIGIREGLICNAILNTTKKYVLEHKDMPISTTSNQSMTFSEYLSNISSSYIISELKRKLSYTSNPKYTEDDLKNPVLADALFKVINPNITEGIEELCLNNNSTKSIVKISFKGTEFNYTTGHLERILKLMPKLIMNNEDSFVDKVRNEIILEAPKHGVDPNKFCFDTRVVNEMKKIDSHSDDSDDYIK